MNEATVRNRNSSLQGSSVNNVFSPTSYGLYLDKEAEEKQDDPHAGGLDSLDQISKILDDSGVIVPVLSSFV